MCARIQRFFEVSLIERALQYYVRVTRFTLQKAIREANKMRKIKLPRSTKKKKNHPKL